MQERTLNLHPSSHKTKTQTITETTIQIERQDPSRDLQDPGYPELGAVCRLKSVLRAQLSLRTQCPNLPCMYRKWGKNSQ